MGIKGNKLIWGSLLLLLTAVLFAGFDKADSNPGSQANAASFEKQVATGRQHLEREQFLEALATFQTLLSSSSQASDGEVIQLRNLIAECQLLSDQASPGIKAQLDQTLEMAEKEFPADHLVKAHSLQNLGLYLMNQKALDAAQTNLEAALKMKQAVLPATDPEIARTLRFLGRLKRQAGEFAPSLAYQRESLRILQKDPKPSYFALSRIYSEISLSFQSFGLLDSAEKYLKQSQRSSWLAQPGGHTLQRADNYYYLGSLNLEKGDLQRAIVCFDSSFIEYSFLKVSPVRRGYSLRKMGECYRNMGDYYKTLDYFQRNYQIIRDNYPLDQEVNYAHTYNNLAAVYHDLGQNEKCLEYLFKSLNVWKTLYPGPVKEKMIFYPPYMNLGETLINLNRFDEAKNYLDSALLALPAATSSLGREAAVHALLARYWAEKNNEGKSGLEFDLSLAKHIVAGASGGELAPVYLLYGKMKARFGHSDRAIELYDEGLKTVCIPQPGVDRWGNPLMDGIRDKGKAFDLLTAKGAALMALGDSVNNLRAYNSFLLAFELQDALRANFQAEGSKIIQSSTAYPSYEKAIVVALGLYRSTGDRSYFDQAFTLSERCKSMVLLEGVSAKKAMSYAGVPDSLVQREQSIDIEIAYYERKFQEAQGRNDSALTKQMGDEVFNRKQEKTKLYSYMKAQYPDYYRLRYQYSISKPTEVRAEGIPGDGVLIEYFLGDSTLIIFGMRRDADTVVVKKIGPAFQDRLLKFRGYLAGFDVSRKAWEHYAHEGHELYQELIGPVRPFLRGTRLTIIPDGVLGYLSFESLLTKPVDSGKGQIYKKLPYLLHDFAVSYDYSATLFTEKRKNSKPRDQYSYLVMAPEFGEGLAPLPGAASFAQEAGQRFAHCTSLHGASATKENFLAEAPTHDVIHLATHALIDDGQPLYSRFVFSSRKPDGTLTNDSLFTFELYGMSLKARLAILDGCSTGDGKLARGEGVMSLARAFSYVGCPSIVMTLWEESDNRSTPIIMSGFFDNLAEGLPLDVAMQRAKIKFLSEVETSSSAHPSLWSELVVIGETSPVPVMKRGTNWLPWISLALIGVGAVGFGFAWRKRK